LNLSAVIRLYLRSKNSRFSVLIFFLIQHLGLRKSRLFCVNLRSIALAFSRLENLNGTQIKSDASHTLISADQAKPGVRAICHADKSS
jgi:hypothetical protein